MPAAPIAAMTRREVKLRIHAWLEEREIAGLDPAFRAQVEVQRGSTYVPVGGGGSPAEVEAVLDRVLAELVATGEVAT